MVLITLKSYEQYLSSNPNSSATLKADREKQYFSILLPFILFIMRKKKRQLRKLQICNLGNVAQKAQNFSRINHCITLPVYL